MLLTRRNQNWLPEVFNTLFDTEWMPKVSTTAPAINVELAAPGMTKDDFKVTLDENENLVIDLEKKVETNNDGEPKETGHYLRREFSYTKFHQTLLLPEDVDREKITATVEHGVLLVTLPKFQPEERKKAAKEITIS